MFQLLYDYFFFLGKEYKQFSRWSFVSKRNGYYRITDPIRLLFNLYYKCKNK